MSAAIYARKLTAQDDVAESRKPEAGRATVRARSQLGGVQGLNR